MSLSVSNEKESLEKFQHCLMGVSGWQDLSWSLILARQTFFLLEPNFNEKKILNNFECLLLGQDTNPSTSAKNLGVIFYSILNFRKHISLTCRACFHHISDLRRIWKSLSLDLSKQIAVALVSSKIIVTHFFTICQKRISLDYTAFKTALQEW